MADTVTDSKPAKLATEETGLADVGQPDTVDVFCDLEHKASESADRRVKVSRRKRRRRPYDAEPTYGGYTTQEVRDILGHSPVMEDASIRAHDDVNKHILDRIRGRVRIEFGPVVMVLQKKPV